MGKKKDSDGFHSKNNKYGKYYDENSPVFNEELRKRINSIILNNINNELNKRNISVSEFSEMTGITYSSLWAALNYADHMIRMDSLIKMAYALEIPMADLFPCDLDSVESNGDRFDFITKELDEKAINYLLNHALNFAIEYKRLKGNG